MRRIVFCSDYDDPRSWGEALERALGPIHYHVWPEVPARAPVDYALAFLPERGALARLPGLKVVFSLGAGVDGLADDATIPPAVPIVRMMDDGLVQGMTEYTVWSVLHAHRDMDDFARLQRARRWDHRDHLLAWERTVAVLGIGRIGGAAARALAALRFKVLGWSRTPRAIEGVECHHGADGLQAVLARAQIVVGLLPLTASTERLFDRRFFAQLPEGAHFINAGRGRQLVPDDLLAALDSGRLRGATLDVFPREPLPEDSPLWTDPRVIVTPHVAGMVMPRSAAAYVVAQIRSFEAGAALANLVERERGY